MTPTEREALRYAAHWIVTRFPERRDQTEVETTRGLYARWLATEMERAAEGEA
ncbi:hypothetical protein [Luteimonas lutimaris]|uniref:hypothetical protein n=1 Tax=Luteimonas lutimaris TaxID=698645 RepID=UPI0031CE4BCB